MHAYAHMIHVTGTYTDAESNTDTATAIDTEGYAYACRSRRSVASARHVWSSPRSPPRRVRRGGSAWHLHAESSAGRGGSFICYYIYIYVYMCVYIYIYIYVYIYIYIIYIHISHHIYFIMCYYFNIFLNINNMLLYCILCYTVRTCRSSGAHEGRKEGGQRPVARLPTRFSSRILCLDLGEILRLGRMLPPDPP